MKMLDSNKKEFEELYNKLHASDFDDYTSYYRKKIWEDTVHMYYVCVGYHLINSNDYVIDDKAKKYQNRFYKVGNTHIKNADANIKISNEFGAGLYMLGQIGIDVNTNKKVYYIKIGRATNISSRIDSYRTHNPNFFLIDTMVISGKKLLTVDLGKLELDARKELVPFCESRIKGTEWFIVKDEKTFLKFKNNGFNALR